jgi:hypothetical protein
MIEPRDLTLVSKYKPSGQVRRNPYLGEKAKIILVGERGKGGHRWAMTLVKARLQQGWSRPSLKATLAAEACGQETKLRLCLLRLAAR